MPKLPKRRMGMRAVSAWTLFENTGVRKPDFHFPEMQTIASIRRQYVPITAKSALDRWINVILSEYFLAYLKAHWTNGLQKWWWTETDNQESHSVQIGNNIVSMMRWCLVILRSRRTVSQWRYLHMLSKASSSLYEDTFIAPWRYLHKIAVPDGWFRSKKWMNL